ncbi:hypothetical protein D3C81_1440440 [compost metagenome]
MSADIPQQLHRRQVVDQSPTVLADAFDQRQASGQAVFPHDRECVVAMRIKPGGGQRVAGRVGEYAAVMRVEQGDAFTIAGLDGAGDRI